MVNMVSAFIQTGKPSEQSCAWQVAENFQLMNEEAIAGHMWADRDPDNLLNPAVPPHLLSRQKPGDETCCFCWFRGDACISGAVEINHDRDCCRDKVASFKSVVLTVTASATPNEHALVACRPTILLRQISCDHVICDSDFQVCLQSPRSTYLWRQQMLL